MSLRMRLFSSALKPIVRTAFSFAKDPVPLREGMDLAAQLTQFVPPGTRVEANDPDTPGLWITPKNAEPDKLILFLHGGGYVAGSPKTHKRVAWRLALLSKARVFLPAYRLAPEFPLPAAFEDALLYWDAVRNAGFDAKNIVVGGDSAGGGLALSLLNKLCEEQDAPAGCFAWSPFTDLTLQSPSMTSNAENDHFFPASRARELTEMILGASDPKDPRVSPIYGQFPKCPPVLLQASSSEILRDDSVRMQQHLQDLGAQVTLSITPNAPHVWQIFDGLFPEARRAIKETSLFANACMN